MNHPKYNYLDHTGDIGLEAWGVDLRDLFLNAAYGMLGLLFDRNTIANVEEKQLDVEAADVELLIVSWLSEIKYLNYEFLTKEIIIDNIKCK